MGTIKIIQTVNTCFVAFANCTCICAVFLSWRMHYAFPKATGSNNCLQEMNYRWMDDLRFFDSISVISGRWADDNERLCAMKPRLRLRRFRPERGSNPDRYISRPALNQPTEVPGSCTITRLQNLHMIL